MTQWHVQIQQITGWGFRWALFNVISKTDVPATALLYDIVNAVYNKMYFYGSCEVYSYAGCTCQAAKCQTHST